MKYEFIRLSDDFKSNSENIYKDVNEDICIDMTKFLYENKKLKSPIGIFINGILLESINYKFENSKVTINKNYPIYPTDRIYMIFTSTDPNNSGYITQYKLFDFSILDDSSISLIDPLVFDENKEIIAINVNGILYSTDLFTIEEDKTVTFSKYRPDTMDDVSILILKK